MSAHPAASGGARCRQAVILAAGEGKRLRPLTDSRPKCLVAVNGEPMLDRIFDALETIGVEDVVIVTGHLDEVLRDHVDRAGRSFAVRYVHNDRYDATNNIVSLWLARSELRPPFILIESDLVLDRHALLALAEPDRMAVARWEPSMNGTVVELDADANVSRLILKRDQGTGDDLSSAWKTVNIYSFSEPLWRDAYRPALEAAVAANQLDDYYEAVLGDLINDGRVAMRAIDFGDRPWIEVDDLTDLERAEALFATA